jgi:hypothetical protein
VAEPPRSMRSLVPGGALSGRLQGRGSWIDGEQMARISSRLRPQIEALEVKQTGQGLRPLMEWYFATADRDEAMKRWDKFDVSQQRQMISAHLGQQGFIRVHKKKNRSRSVEPETIKIRWSLGNEAAGPDDPDVIPPAPRPPANK